MSLRRGRGASVYQLRDEMDRLLGGFFPTAARAASMVNGRSFPAINVWENGDNLFAEAEVPGLKSEQIEISVVGDELTVKGSRTTEENTAEQNAAQKFHRRERGVGEFTRVIQLPSEVDADKVSAKLENGVLLITLPKAEKAKPRKIQVSVG